MNIDPLESDKKTVTVDLRSCARCGANHEQIVFTSFKQPIEDSDGTIWNYWGICPFNDEPILLRIGETENK